MKYRTRTTVGRLCSMTAEDAAAMDNGSGVVSRLSGEEAAR